MLSEKYTTCERCGKKPPEVLDFVIGNQVLCKTCSGAQEKAPIPKSQICPECARSVPANWSIPFAQLLKRNRGKCQTCLDMKVGPNGEPVPTEVAD